MTNPWKGIKPDYFCDTWDEAKPYWEYIKGRNWNENIRPNWFFCVYYCLFRSK